MEISKLEGQLAKNICQEYPELLQDTKLLEQLQLLKDMQVDGLEYLNELELDKIASPIQHKRCRLAEEQKTNAFLELPRDLQQMIITSCDLKLKRINLVKQMVQSDQSDSYGMNQLKMQYQECSEKEENLCAEIEKRKSAIEPPNAVGNESHFKKTNPPQVHLNPKSVQESPKAVISKAGAPLWVSGRPIKDMQDKEHVGGQLMALRPSSTEDDQTCQSSEEWRTSTMLDPPQSPPHAQMQELRIQQKPPVSLSLSPANPFASNSNSRSTCLPRTNVPSTGTVCAPTCEQQAISKNKPPCGQLFQWIWTGNVTFENYPEKGVSKELKVSAFAPNVCNPNVAPLIAQFEGPSAISDTLTSSWPGTMHVGGVCSSENVHFFKKYSLGIFVMFPESQPAGNQEAFFFVLQQLMKNGWAGVVDLPQNTLLLVPFRPEKMLGIVLSKMNVTLAMQASCPTTQTTKQLAYTLSAKYNQDGHLHFDNHMVDGFYDPGRSAAGDLKFPTLECFESQPYTKETREVLLVDKCRDSALKEIVKKAEDMLQSFADLESQARVLSLFVSNTLGGDSPCPEKCAAEIGKLKEARKSNVIPIGEITIGVCRHRAVLYKYLCDKFGIDCELKRGEYCATNSVIGAHAWNVIKLGMQYFVVDVMHGPTQLYPNHSPKAENYIHKFDKCETDKNNCYERKASLDILRPELSLRRFVRLPNLREKAVFHERLGRGGFGSVYRITLGGLSCALKKISLENSSPQQTEAALREVQVMEMLSHENIIKYLGHELVEEKKELHILMELFPLSLGQLIEKRRQLNQQFRSAEIKHLAIEMLNGIDYLHAQKIVHRDLKPDNILIDMDDSGKVNKVKITDFGVCKILSDNGNNSNHTCVGTETYMAPEVLACSTHTCMKADIWSFGMVLVELMTMFPPYHGVPKHTCITNIQSGILPPLPDASNLRVCESRLLGIIESCLQLDPTKRPTAEQLVISFFRLQCPL